MRKKVVLGQVSLFDFDMCIDTKLKMAAGAENISYHDEVIKPVEQSITEFVQSASADTLNLVNAILSNEVNEEAKETITLNDLLKPYLGKKDCEVHALCSLPANDGNFGSSLQKASVNDLTTALEFMETYPKGNSGRIAGVKRQLKKLGEPTITKISLNNMITDFVKKYHKVGIEDWGPVISDEFKEFAKAYKKLVEALANKNKWKVEKFHVGHYDLNFYLVNQDNKVCFLSFSVPRGEFALDLYNKGAHDGILVRRTKDIDNCYTNGWNNYFTNISSLEQELYLLFSKEYR